MRRVIFAICATAAALVLLLSFKTHTQSRPGAVPPAALGSRTPGAAGGTAAASATATATAGLPAGTASRTVTGDAVQTMYGPVQLQVNLKAGKITGIKVLQYPDGTPRDYQINSYAIPSSTPRPWPRAARTSTWSPAPPTPRRGTSARCRARWTRRRPRDRGETP